MPYIHIIICCGEAGVIAFEDDAFTPPPTREAQELPSALQAQEVYIPEFYTKK